MSKMMKTMGTMMALGAAGYGMYTMMNSKKVKGQMKKIMKSPYTMNSSTNVKSN
ncbi:MAG: hypothetical protein IJO63_02530 [Bacilli bacterium]|nr:hypothetical protein [Bacilli bacterium]